MGGCLDQTDWHQQLHRRRLFNFFTLAILSNRSTKQKCRALSIPVSGELPGRRSSNPFLHDFTQACLLNFCRFSFKGGSKANSSPLYRQWKVFGAQDSSVRVFYKAIGTIDGLLRAALSSPPTKGHTPWCIGVSAAAYRFSRRRHGSKRAAHP